MHETGRLRIQNLTPDDAAFILKLLRSPGWLRFIGDRGVRNEEGAVRYIQQSLLPAYAKGFGMHKISHRFTNEPLGICGFLQRDFLSHPDLGFALLPEHEAQGYMFEATASLLTHKTSNPQFHTILAITNPDNHACQKLLRKLKFVKRGRVQPKTGADSLLLFEWKKPQ